MRWMKYPLTPPPPYPSPSAVFHYIQSNLVNIAILQIFYLVAFKYPINRLKRSQKGYCLTNCIFFDFQTLPIFFFILGDITQKGYDKKRTALLLPYMNKGKIINSVCKKKQIGIFLISSIIFPAYMTTNGMYFGGKPLYFLPTTWKRPYFFL